MNNLLQASVISDKMHESQDAPPAPPRAQVLDAAFKSYLEMELQCAQTQVNLIRVMLGRPKRCAHCGSPIE